MDTNKKLEECGFDSIQPEVITNRSFIFPGQMNKCRETKLQYNINLTLKEKVLIWLDCTFPRFMIFRMKLKGWKF